MVHCISGGCMMIFFYINDRQTNRTNKMMGGKRNDFRRTDGCLWDEEVVSVHSIAWYRWMAWQGYPEPSAHIGQVVWVEGTWEFGIKNFVVFF